MDGGSGGGEHVMRVMLEGGGDRDGGRRGGKRPCRGKQRVWLSWGGGGGSGASSV